MKMKAGDFWEVAFTISEIKVGSLEAGNDTAQSVFQHRQLQKLLPSRLGVFGIGSPIPSPVYPDLTSIKLIDDPKKAKLPPTLLWSCSSLRLGFGNLFRGCLWCCLCLPLRCQVRPWPLGRMAGQLRNVACAGHHSEETCHVWIWQIPKSKLKIREVEEAGNNTDKLGKTTRMASDIGDAWHAVRASALLQPSHASSEHASVGNLLSSLEGHVAVSLFDLIIIYSYIQCVYINLGLWHFTGLTNCIIHRLLKP